MTERSLIKPKRLRPGDTLGVVVPASPFDRDLFDQGLARIEQMGFRVTLARGAFDRDGYLAGSDNNRAHQILRFFADPEVSGIICARGGYGSLRLISLIDFDRIRRQRK